jgi:hemerythrin-like domain-containing protein
MKTVNKLVNEHRIIEQVLNCLERMIDRCRNEGRLEAGPAQDALAFFREFAESSHLAKEEAHLFPLVAGTKCPQGCHPEELVARDEDHGHAHLEAMSAAVERAAEGDRAAVKHFIEHGEAYTALLMKYIENEEDWLFPQASRILSEDVERGLATELQKTEAQKTSSGSAEKYIAIANRLADHFGVPRAELDS